MLLQRLAQPPHQLTSTIKVIVQEKTYLIFYTLLVCAFLLVDMSTATPLLVVVTLIGALFIADFVSGLWHLFIDYYPINYEIGYDELLFYQGDRSGKEFIELRDALYARGTELDKLAYHFKRHHKKPRHERNINKLFMDTGHQAFGVLIYAIILVIIAKIPFFNDVAFFNWPYKYPEVILFWLLFAVFIANIEFIHHCIHHPKDYPVGGKVIAALQKGRLIYDKKVHTRHHSGDGTGFCFVTGQANFIVNRICGYLLKKELIYQHHWHGGR